jgi:Domain of unknown function (DUF4157)
VIIRRLVEITLVANERKKAMKSDFSRTSGSLKAPRFGNSLVIKFLLLALLFSVVCLTPPARTMAQDQCQDLNELMNFNYQSWGIGKFRNCDCDLDDLECIANLPFCQAKKVEEIVAGALFASWIIGSRNDAVGGGVSPIPNDIRSKLDSLYPASILDNVYYTTDTGSFGTLQWFRDEMGKAGAITLVDVIVFADANRATTDAKLWAHELEHVRQYQQLGVDGFAQVYANQTCILPGELGYDSGRCQIEWMAKRKSEYYNREGFITCCTTPVTFTLQNRVLNGTESFAARDSLFVGPNVLITAGGNVTLRAGRIIQMLSSVRTEAGGKLSATIDGNLNQTCAMPPQP